MTRDQLYQQAAAELGPALERLAKAYEADPDHRLDLLQEIHIAAWRSFASFAEQCSLRTWVYRVAHTVAASHVLRDRRAKARGLVSLEEIEPLVDVRDAEADADRERAVERLHVLIRKLKPLDRELILLYLDGLDAA